MRKNCSAILGDAASKSQRLGPTRLMAAFSLNPSFKSTDNLTSFLKKLRDHRGSRESRQEWRLVFLAPVTLSYGEVKNFSWGTCVTRKEIIMILAIIALFLLGYPTW